MALLETQFSSILDRYNAVAVWNEGRERIEHCRLACACTTGDDDVEAGRNAGFEKLGDARSKGAFLDQFVRRHSMLGKLTDADGRADQRYGRDDDIDARAIRKAGIHHGAAFIDAAAEGGHNTLNYAQNIVVVTELDLRFFQLACSFNKDVVGAVDEHFRHRIVVQQRFKRAIAQNVRQDKVKDVIAFEAAEGQPQLSCSFVKDTLDNAAHFGGVAARNAGVEFSQETLLDAVAHCHIGAVGAAVTGHACRPGAGQ